MMNNKEFALLMAGIILGTSLLLSGLRAMDQRKPSQGEKSVIGLAQTNEVAKVQR